MFLKSNIYHVSFLGIEIFPKLLSKLARLNTIFLTIDKFAIRFLTLFLEWSSSKIASSLQRKPHSIQMVSY